MAIGVWIESIFATMTRNFTLVHNTTHLSILPSAAVALCQADKADRINATNSLGDARYRHIVFFIYDSRDTVEMPLPGS